MSVENGRASGKHLRPTAMTLPGAPQDAARLSGLSLLHRPMPSSSRLTIFNTILFDRLSPSFVVTFKVGSESIATPSTV